MTLPKPLLSRVVQLNKNAGTKGMPSSVHVTAWGKELVTAQQVIFYFGGMPASAHEPALHSLHTGESDIYKSKHIHLIYMDKPGMGKTPMSYSFQIRRDWPEMVRQVQETFGIQRYSVMGVSNGGPYVMATLTHEATKDHIDCAAMIVGVSNVRASNYFSIRHPSGFFEGFFNSMPILVTGPLTAIGLNAALLYLSRLGGFRKLVATIPAFRLPEAQAALSAILDDTSRTAGLGAAMDCQQGLSPLYAQSIEQTNQTYRQIQIPVQLWYGTEDTSVPLHTAEWLRDILPRAQLHTRTTGHALYFFHTAEVLDSIIRCGAAVADVVTPVTPTPP